MAYLAFFHLTSSLRRLYYLVDDLQSSCGHSHINIHISGNLAYHVAQIYTNTSLLTTPVIVMNG
jgi:hypothetical protein